MIEYIFRIIKMPFDLSIKTAEKLLPYSTKNYICNSFVFDMYSKNYFRLKFLNWKIENKFHIMPSDMTVHWISTYNCNFRCKHCEASAGDKRVSELSTDEICNLITELSRMKIKKIVIGGGECLLRKDIFIIIGHILKMGLEYEIESNSYLVSNFKEEFRNMKPRTYFTIFSLRFSSVSFLCSKTIFCIKSAWKSLLVWNKALLLSFCSRNSSILFLPFVILFSD